MNTWTQVANHLIDSLFSWPVFVLVLLALIYRLSVLVLVQTAAQAARENPPSLTEMLAMLAGKKGK